MRPARLLHSLRSGGVHVANVHWPSRHVRLVLVLVLVLLGGAIPGFAQGLGVRAGVSVDPDQFYFGGHYETAALVDRLHFRPNLELGIGDDLVTTALNFEFVYKFPTRSGWRLVCRRRASRQLLLLR